MFPAMVRVALQYPLGIGDSRLNALGMRSGSMGWTGGAGGWFTLNHPQQGGGDSLFEPGKSLFVIPTQAGIYSAILREKDGGGRGKLNWVKR
jgi:hypothetical protein